MTFLQSVTPEASSATSAGRPDGPPPIPDYELLRAVGSGSYGEVWLARGVTGAFRAIKVVWRSRFPDRLPYDREFNGLREFAAISLLESRQLALLHVGRNEAMGFFYYVMELADDAERGREIDPLRYVPHTLREMRSRRTRLKAAEAIELGTELARGLATMHAHGLVHRDIKPSNVILVGGVPKLADIGLVAATGSARTFVGTEGYVPPEGPGAPSADVYALGKLLYELATGLDRMDYPRLPPDLASIPDRKKLLELNEVLIRACEPTVNRRHQDASGLLDELLLLQAGRSVRRLRTAERHLSRTFRAAAILAITASVAGAGALIEHRRAAKAEAERDELRRRTVYAATLAQAQRAIDQSDYGRARKLLEGAKAPGGSPDLCGFEWRALTHQALGDPCEIIRDQGPPIDKVVLSPDGTHLVVHDASAAVVIYHASTRQEIRRISGVERLGGISTDGIWIVGTGKNGAIQRWKFDGSSDGPAGSTVANGYTPLGTQGSNRLVALSNTEFPSLIVWDFAEGRAVVSLPLTTPEENVAWSLYRSAFVANDGQEAVLGLISGRSNNSKLRLAFASLGDRPQLWLEPPPVRPSAVGLIANARDSAVWWAADDSTGKQAVLNRANRRWDEQPDRLPRGITAQAVIGTGDDQIFVQAHGSQLSLRHGSQVASLYGHASLISCLLPAHDGRHFFTASTSGELRMWAADSGTSRRWQRQCWNSQSTASRALFSANGGLLFVPEDGRNTAVLDAATLELQSLIPNMLRPFSVASDIVWGLAADSHAIVKWDSRTRNPPTELARDSSPVVLAALSRDGQQLCYTRRNGELWVQNIAITAPPRLVSVQNENIYPLELDQQGSRLWNSGSNRVLRCRTLSDNSTQWTRLLPVRATTLRWLQRTNEIVVALENGDLRYFDATTGATLRIVPSGSAAAQSISLTPDENRLVIAGIEGDVHVLEASSGRYLAGLHTNLSDTLHYLSISPTENAAAVLSKSGMLRIIRTQ